MRSYTAKINHALDLVAIKEGKAPSLDETGASSVTLYQVKTSQERALTQRPIVEACIHARTYIGIFSSNHLPQVAHAA